MSNTFEIILQILSSPVGILAAIFFFGASIFVHEYGHYLAARWRGLKIERFSIGMGPRIFGWKDRRGVIWQVSWLPIGGYVLLPQLAEMTTLEGGSESDARDLPPLSWTDKVTVSVAGAVFNILFAFALGCIVWVFGLPRPAGEESTTLGVVIEAYEDAAGESVTGPAFAAGLQPGDTILSIDGEPVHDFEDVRNEILVSTGRTAAGAPSIRITYERGGETRTADVLPVIATGERIRTIGILGTAPSVVGAVFPDSPAEAAGILPGDEIVGVSGNAVVHPSQIAQAIQEHTEGPLAFTIARGDQRLEIPIEPRFARMSEDGEARKMIGVRWQDNFVNVSIPPWVLIADVAELTYTTISALVHPDTNVGLRNLSGPIGILNIMRLTAEQGFLFLLWIVIIINVNLAILNLLPLPILDGGHILFATIQKVTGRPVPPRLIASLQAAMVVFLLGVMLYVSFFDVRRTGQVEQDRLEEERAATRYFDTPQFLPADFRPPEKNEASPQS